MISPPGGLPPLRRIQDKNNSNNDFSGMLTAKSTWGAKLAALHGPGLMIALKVICVVIGIFAAAGVIAFGGTGLAHAYAHVSLQAFGKLGWLLGTIPAGYLYGIVTVGVVGVIAAAIGSAKIHYARQAQLPVELQSKFFDDAEELESHYTDGTKVKDNPEVKALTRGQFNYWWHGNEGEGKFYLVLRTNSISGKLKYTKYMTFEETKALASELQKAHYVDRGIQK